MKEKDIFLDYYESYRLFENESGELFFGVLCGGVGMFEAKIKLSKEEIEKYQSEGQKYLKILAEDIRHNTSKYSVRFVA
ncbi:hypothetical protein BSZ31_03050 [Limnobacter sp. SAORIC-690]|jgi:hypothetical protein|uniref:Uncharacterized protein n=1 Tax=Limnobacter profundi TaxID=2732163 RepID=A0ABX6N8L6_9BURK|nr:MULTISPECIES: hypothetical protein [unclassified Limnobacter]MBA4314383.1 hypothetical protein [Alcaligenaceae bacterium]PZO13609.1 MAG: hypothetical protein DCE87_12690 [Betaproteobacteria bacterium]PQJ24106.1 hypothetical protein BSZ31_03050 [Limnobacter sp. SAORIC-690]PZO23396.1 MAG: hypothetical protein DCE89_10185 [Betaproteobacteria bacterium]PZO31338.1 MAG: hypothetical protein DCE88_04080 [Betaproteobacteria bacterium]|tara:strand:+ start:603 stop:839 length:237 start_codon:yes stop_codon:yes gene_type:complete